MRVHEAERHQHASGHPSGETCGNWLVSPCHLCGRQNRLESFRCQPVVCERRFLSFAVIFKHIEPWFVKFLRAHDLAEHLRQFAAIAGLPQGVGALDGCHLEVCPPKEYASDYLKYKGWYSTIFLAVADHSYRFLYTNVGSPGRNHDAAVFRPCPARGSSFPPTVPHH